MAQKIVLEMKKLRIYGRQTKRGKYTSESLKVLKDYYKIFVYIPLLDEIIQD